MSHCNESTPVETTPQTTKQGTYSGSVEGTHHRLTATFASESEGESQRQNLSFAQCRIHWLT